MQRDLTPLPGPYKTFSEADYARSIAVALAVKRGRRAPVERPSTARGAVVERLRECPTPNPWNGATCKRRGCACCGFPWVKSWEAVSRINLGHRGSALVLITITPPGADRLPWSCGKVHDHGPRRGCKVKADYADLWSADVTTRLARLRDAARLAVKRAGLPVDGLWLERVWEPQNRGVPHAHVVAAAGTPRELEAAERFADELRRLAPDYDFGPRVDITRPMPAAEAARYLSGYLLGRSAKKGTIRDNLGDPRMPRSLIYVARALTSETLVTMRRMRVVRWYFAARAGRVHVFPRLYGLELFAIARVCVLLDRSNAPPDVRYLEHMSALRLMRRLAGAADVQATADEYQARRGRVFAALGVSPNRGLAATAAAADS